MNVVFQQVYDGEWVRPNMHKWKMKCCDCGLVHQLQFRVTRKGKRNELRFRAYRLPKKKI